MKLCVNWQKYLRLRDGTKEGLIYSLTIERLPESSGIYIFARTHGKSFEALYVGKATNIRMRIRQQLESNVRLMKHLKSAHTGKRIILIGVVETKQAQQLHKVLKIIERAFIKRYLAEGHDLVNRQGTRLRRHKIINERDCYRKYIPSEMYIEKQ